VGTSVLKLPKTSRAAQVNERSLASEIDHLRELRTYHLRAYHASLRVVLNRGLIDPQGWRAADTCQCHEQLFHPYDMQIDALRARDAQRPSSSQRRRAA
jgi:hypothetical protein